MLIKYVKILRFVKILSKVYQYKYHYECIYLAAYEIYPTFCCYKKWVAYKKSPGATCFVHIDGMLASTNVVTSQRFYHMYSNVWCFLQSLKITSRSSALLRSLDLGFASRRLKDYSFICGPFPTIWCSNLVITAEAVSDTELQQ